jgi:hypothetical protein
MCSEVQIEMTADIFNTLKEMEKEDKKFYISEKHPEKPHQCIDVSGPYATQEKAEKHLTGDNQFVTEDY